MLSLSLSLPALIVVFIDGDLSRDRDFFTESVSSPVAFEIATEGTDIATAEEEDEEEIEAEEEEDVEGTVNVPRDPLRCRVRDATSPRRIAKAKGRREL